MLTWPGTVPTAIVADGFEVSQLAAAPLATEMNAGTTRHRRKYSLRIALVKCSIRMAHAQLDAFKAFHAALGDGAGRFTMPVYDGSRYVARTCQIAEGPSIGGADTFGYRRVSLTLRVENL